MNNSQPASVAATIGLDRPSGRRRHWLWVLLIALVGAVAIGYLRSRPAAPTDYVLDEVRRGTLRVTVTATGTLQPTNQVEVGSEVSGFIAEVLVDFNDRVAAGEIMARLDTETLEARVASARASLAVAEAARAQAEATVVEAQARAARSRDLAERNLTSVQALETDVAAAHRAVASVQSAEAQVTAARAALQETETALRKTAIRSPIDGVVISREIDPGQTVAASFQTPVLFKLADDLTHMRLHLDVDESDIGSVREGQHAKFRVDAYPRREFDARIVAVRFNPRTVNNIVTYETVLSVMNPELLLRPGMTATADILVTERPDVLLVPNRALRFLPPERIDERQTATGDSVWVLRDGAPVEVPITVGLANDEMSEVTSTELAPGTEVIIDIERAPRQQGGGGPFG